LNEFKYNTLILSIALPPHYIEVFLDYEVSIASFFNVANHGSLIYRFFKCFFSQPVYPYFSPWNCSGPIAEFLNFIFPYPILCNALVPKLRSCT
jgi:hypothetical protein